MSRSVDTAGLILPLGLGIVGCVVALWIEIHEAQQPTAAAFAKTTSRTLPAPAPTEPPLGFPGTTAVAFGGVLETAVSGTATANCCTFATGWGWPRFELDTSNVVGYYALGTEPVRAILTNGQTRRAIPWCELTPARRIGVITVRPCGPDPKRKRSHAR